MKTPCRLLLVALVLLSCAGAKPSATEAAPQTNQTATTPQPAATNFTEPEGLLHLDVVVANASGSPVAGLAAADFTLLDNGQPAKIVSFHAYSVAAPPHPPVDITLLLDTFQVPRELQNIEHQQIENFLRQNGGQLTQPLSVLILNDAGLWRAGPPSIDGNILADAIAHNRVTHWGSGVWVPGLNQPPIFSNRGTLADRGTIDAFSTALPPPIAALQALGAFAAAARRQPGRKLLLWFGPGRGIASGNDPNLPTDSQQEKQALFDRIVWFSTLLRLSHIGLCSVSPIDLRPATSGQVEIPPPDFPSVALHPATSPLDATTLALNRQVLAIESGGSAPDPTSGDPVHQLNDCVRAPSAFYTLTFNPAPAQHIDEFHGLKVNLRAPHLTARTITGYYDQPYYTDAPNPAIRQLTVAQLDQLPRTAQASPDAALAAQLSSLELTERADAAQIASWTAQLHGKKSREALEALADASAFLDPPPAAILPDPPPDRNAQQQMISLATGYLNQTIPHLPNFFAQRSSVEYDETPAFDHGDGHFTTAEPLHVVETSKTTVLYRNGAEVESKPSRREKSSHWQVVYGTFGPALSAVKGVLANPATLTWSHWEKDSGAGRRAVFRYVVPASASQFRTGGCCLPYGDATGGFTTRPGYHGEIAIDPASGAILRVETLADLPGFVPTRSLRSHGLLRPGHHR
ncbi:MAG: VWA domain-containing protein [Acidobacteriaceae bacterium]